MSYNTELQANNADLQEILDAVNALPDATELPELTNPGTAEDLEADKQLIDAEGNIVTGTVRVAHGGITQEADSINRIPMGDQSRIKLTVHVEEKTIIKPSTGNVISLTAPCSEFGDATAEDVAKGKTFTSAAGLKAVGTKEETVPQLECGTYWDIAANSSVVFWFEPGLTWEQYENSAYNIGMLGSQFYVGEDGYVYNGNIRETVLYDGETGEKVLGTDLVKPILYNDVGAIG